MFGGVGGDRSLGNEHQTSTLGKKLHTPNTHPRNACIAAAPMPIDFW
jgi:hypothetical protein